MKKSFWIILLLSISLSVLAQNKNTEYIDSDWQQTSKDSAAFYKVGIEKGGYFIGGIEIYYISGKLWGKAFYTDDHILEGYFISFYENGDTTQTGYYNDNRFYLINYWDVNRKQVVKNGNGEITKYHSNGKVQEICQYKNEILFGEDKCWDSTGVLIAHYRIVEDTLADSSTFIIPEVITLLGKENKVLVANGNGKYVKYYKDGQIEDIGQYLNRRKNGIWISYYRHGIISSKGKYKDGIKVGRWTHRYNSGKLMKVENYKDGNLEGYKFLYNLEGKIIERETYSNGVKIASIQFDN